MSSIDAVSEAAAPGAAAAAKGWRAGWDRRFARWLAERHPPRSQLVLDQRTVFVFPTRQGLGFALVVTLLLIGAINYQNSLVYLLAFLLGGVFIVTILATYRNLAGVQIGCSRAHACHAGEHAQFEVRLAAVDRRHHYGLHVGWPGQECVVVDLADEPVTVTLGVLASRRGRLAPGRLLIETFYPLGLVRTWSWIDFGVQPIVYPRALAGPLPPDSGVADSSGRKEVRADGEDLYGLRDYRFGDTPRAIAWKQFAARGHVRTKEFAAGVGHTERWLRWRDLPGAGTEERLQRLTGWTLAAARSGRPYGVELPGQRFPPAASDVHRRGVLEALALFGLEALPRAERAP